MQANKSGLVSQAVSTSLIDRRRGSAVEVPTAHYVGAEGRRITIIGLKHYASANFWLGIQSELDALPATTVIHFEKPINDRPVWSRLSWIKAAVGDRIDAGMKILWIGAGCRFQFDELVVGGNWENYDTSTSRILGATFLGALLVGAGLLALMTANRKVARFCGRGLVRSLVVHAGENQSLGGVIKTSVVLDERNEIAAEAALASEFDVVMLWGDAHLKGIGARLEAQGFRLERVSWRTLLEAPTALSASAPS